MSVLARLARESGASTLAGATFDAKVMCLLRFLRLLAFGATFLHLVKYLLSVGISDEHVGLFLTLTLLGDAVISLILTLVTDQLGRRLVLLIGSAGMMVSGVVFAICDNYWLLLAASIVGVISPSGNEVGPFLALEESVLAQLVDKDKRSDIFTWYRLIGSAGAALGSLLGGWSVELLSGSFDQVSTYRIIFAGYAAIGAVKVLCTLLLSRDVEVDYVRADYQPLPQSDASAPEAGSAAVSATAAGGLTEEEDGQEELPPARPSLGARLRALVPAISSASISILLRLLLLFAIDSFASGLASPSWLTYFFTTEHHLSSSTLGTLFLVTNILATLSNFAALPLAHRLGPLVTMCVTHIPSSIFLGLVPLPSSATPTGTWLAMMFLALRSSTQSMDQAPRQAFLSAAVLPSERTAVLGIVNVAKTLAQAGGVGVSGIFAEAKNWRFMFGIAGALKVSYDLLMLAMFLGVRDREDVAAFAER